MRHMDLIEIHDHPRFPALLRDLFTDALEGLWNFGNSYSPVLPRLRRAIAIAGSVHTAAGSTQVVDLCSGGGGPWPRINRDLAAAEQPPLRVCLTDKYPNREAFQRVLANSSGCITFEPRSIDATSVPPGLSGFRTIFSSFHHFNPVEARNVLRDAIASHQGIAVFELARPALKTMLVICFIPVLVLLHTPSIRPFRWSRLLFNYVIPVIPLALWIDGLISCLRAYSHDELAEMIHSIQADAYRWELGEERSGLLAVTYLIGYPVATDAIDQPISH
jgi:hypothetical protein